MILKKFITITYLYMKINKTILKTNKFEMKVKIHDL